MNRFPGSCPSSPFKIFVYLIFSNICLIHEDNNGAIFCFCFLSSQWSSLTWDLVPPNHNLVVMSTQLLLHFTHCWLPVSYSEICQAFYYSAIVSRPPKYCFSCFCYFLFLWIILLSFEWVFWCIQAHIFNFKFQFSLSGSQFFHLPIEKFEHISPEITFKYSETMNSKW